EGGGVRSLARMHPPLDNEFENPTALRGRHAGTGPKARCQGRSSHRFRAKGHRPRPAQRGHQRRLRLALPPTESGNPEQRRTGVPSHRPPGTRNHPAAPGRTGVARVRGMKESLLIIEDNPSLRDLLQAQLLAESEDRPAFHVETAGSAAEARRILTDLDPVLILCDMRLPDANGIDLIPELKALSGQAPVVIMTAHSDLGSTIRAMKNGAFDYLPKPFSDRKSVV